jgi:aspartyl-tRNA(Asn)/glutamyl-tRNA(Gln) amidotransferase subunit A
VRAITTSYDALLMPTVPIVAPRLRDLESDEAYSRINLLMLRNPTLANFLDGCSISIPCHRHGDAPVGLMLIGLHGDDARLLAIAGTIESLVAPM